MVNYQLELRLIFNNVFTYKRKVKFNDLHFYFVATCLHPTYNTHACVCTPTQPTYVTVARDACECVSVYI